MQENHHLLCRLENADTYLIMGCTSQINLKRYVCIWLEHRISCSTAVRTWFGKPNSWGIAEVQGRANCSYWWFWSNASSGEKAKKSEMLSMVPSVERQWPQLLLIMKWLLITLYKLRNMKINRNPKWWIKTINNTNYYHVLYI